MWGYVHLDGKEGVGVSRSYFDNLAGVRGTAAAVVLLAHVVQLHFLRFGLNTSLHQVSSIASEYAVVLFFILSGYLITHTLEANIERNGKLRLDFYAAARIARLYPPFLYAVGVSLLVFLVVDIFGLPGRGKPMRLPGDLYAAREIVHLSLGEIKRALLMLQGMLEINGPLWSLYIEAKLYVLFACALALIIGGRGILSNVILAAVFYYVAKAGVELNPGFAGYAAMWLIGALAYYVWNERGGWRNRVLMCAALIISAELWHLIVDRTVLLIVARDVLVATLISWLLFKRRVRIPVPQRLADCSYSLYATHFPVLLLAQSLLISTGSVSVGAAIGVAILSTAAAAGVALVGGVIESKKSQVQNWLITSTHSLKIKSQSPPFSARLIYEKLYKERAMTFTSLLERVSRKSISLKNKVLRQDSEKIRLLGDLMRNSPRSHAGAQDWAQQCAELIESNLLDRISKKDIALILAGLVSYRNTGVTPQMSHMALVRAYENSSGLMQDLLHKILFYAEFEAGQPLKSNFFGEVAPSEVDAIQKELDEQGYVVLPWRLDQSWVNALVAEAGNFGYTLRNPAHGERENINRKIDPANPPKCVAAFAKSTDLSASKLLSDFSNDPLLVNLASRHINASAVPIGLSLWYSFASEAPSADAAQLFHYDLDTLRWLKVFVYLTDVGPDNGAHEYVPSSHKPGTKPQALMDREYARLEDEEIDEHCPQGRRSICGPRGTVILGDTSCIHKGNSVIADYRLIFSPIYAASRVGYFHGE